MAIAKKPVTKMTETMTETMEAAAATVTAPEFTKPFVEMQEKVRAGTEKGIDQLRTQYATLKSNAETATDNLEQSLAAAHAGTRELNMKMLDLFRAGTNAGFAHLQALFAAKTLPDAIKLQQDFAKKQVEMMQANSKDMAELAKKVATDVAEPVKASIVLPFKR
jgi:phasin